MFLDTSVIITMIGCPDEARLPEEAKPAVHVTHIREAVKRIVEAVYELHNTGKVDDTCLKSIAQQVYGGMGVGRRSRLSRLRVKTAATRLLDKVLSERGVEVVDIGVNDERLPSCEPRVGAPLSREDKVLLWLATVCHVIITDDNGIIDCCMQVSIGDKCRKARI